MARYDYQRTSQLLRIVQQALKMFKNFVPVLLVFLSVGTASHTAPPQGAKVVALSGGQYKSVRLDTINRLLRKIPKC